MTIHTQFIQPPILDRNFDWSATDDSYEPSDLIGYGSTEQEAIKSLMEQQDGCLA